MHFSGIDHLTISCRQTAKVKQNFIKNKIKSHECLLKTKKSKGKCKSIQKFVCRIFYEIFNLSFWHSKCYFTKYAVSAERIEYTYHSTNICMITFIGVCQQSWKEKTVTDGILMVIAAGNFGRIRKRLIWELLMLSDATLNSWNLIYVRNFSKYLFISIKTFWRMK